MFLKIIKVAKKREGAGGRGGPLSLKVTRWLSGRDVVKKRGNILMSVAV